MKNVFLNIKHNFENEIRRIQDMHRSGARGIRVALILTQCYDKLLQSIFKYISMDPKHLAIVALGGYGRKELCFNSDVDVMFLTPDEGPVESVISSIHVFLHSLMDIGLNIGHSVRNISECNDLIGRDIESRISLVEARFICGDKSLFHRLVVESLDRALDEKDKISIVNQMSDGVVLRHREYGNTSRLLEPNIKNSAGGLRDIHTAFWIMRGTGYIQRPKVLGNNETAVLHMLKSAVFRRKFTPLFIGEIRAAFDFLLRVRNEMHLQSDSLHDILEFSIQADIASGLRYHSSGRRKKVELFMQDYYNASRSVALLCSRVIDLAKSKWLNSDREVKISKSYGPFIIRNKQIDLAKNKGPISNELLLQAFLLRNERNIEFSFRFEDMIHRRLHFIKPLNKKIETGLFGLLLHRPNSVGNSIRKMNELGLLEKWIPEWKPMSSFFQHNQYHFYTVDEHTIIALTNAEALQGSDSQFGSVYRSLSRRDTLYLACLFHDIAKPIHIGRHEINGVQIAKRILKRFHFDDVIDDVTFLVRNHLLMEQVAFRRDLSDPHTIIDFANVFDRVELLDYLYILTYADLSAVNRSVLTEWKELLLSDLYRKTRTILVEEMTSQEIHTRTLQQTEQKRNDILKDLVGIFPQEAVEKHIGLLSDPSYLSAFKPEEIAAHVNTNNLNENVMTLFHHHGRYSEVTFLSRDERGILSKLCGVLTANNANILDAQVFTREDGLVIDKFRISDFVSHREISEEICDNISRDIQEVIAGRVDITHLIERHRTRWKRRVKPINPNTRCDVVFKDHPQYTLMDIYAPDTLGLLYQIAETISRLKLNIARAKISTRVDGIIDSFYILDSNGNKLKTSAERIYVKKEILAAIKRTKEPKLAVLQGGQ